MYLVSSHFIIAFCFVVCFASFRLACVVVLYLSKQDSNTERQDDLNDTKDMLVRHFFGDGVGVKCGLARGGSLRILSLSSSCLASSGLVFSSLRPCLWWCIASWDRRRFYVVCDILAHILPMAGASMSSPCLVGVCVCGCGCDCDCTIMKLN